MSGSKFGMCLRSNVWSKALAFGCILALGMLLGAIQAEAAVRKCAPAVTSDISQADSELMGKRKALLSWTVKAIKSGANFGNWRLADKKVLGCKPAVSPAKGFECIAYASPCVVEQNPALPKRRMRPGRKSVIEV